MNAATGLLVDNSRRNLSWDAPSALTQDWQSAPINRQITENKDFEFFDKKVRLQNTIALCVDQMWSSNPDDDNYVSPGAVRLAFKFIENLPAGAELPKVNSDDEGGVLFVWDLDDESKILMLGEDHIDFVYRPGLDDAFFLTDLPYAGAKIPDDIAKFLAS